MIDYQITDVVDHSVMKLDVLDLIDNMASKELTTTGYHGKHNSIISNTNWDDKCQQLYWSCSGDSDLDTRDLLRGHNVVMYPNPMGDVLNILVNAPVAIKVYDITGKLVIKVKQNQTHKGLNQLDVSLLPSGMYNFTVIYEGNKTTKQVIKR